MNRDIPQHRWPFDPLQPDEHEPTRLPEEAERVQKQTGAGKKEPPPDHRNDSEERAK